jgi:hypothetical protein
MMGTVQKYLSRVLQYTTDGISVVLHELENRSLNIDYGYFENRVLGWGYLILAL